MRRFRQGATRGPGLLRPGAGYGRLCFGAPGPTQEVEPRPDLEPEMFTCENIQSIISEIKKYHFERDNEGNTVLDLSDQ